MHVRSRPLLLLGASALCGVSALFSGCVSPGDANLDANTSLYALSEGASGVYLYPPLGPSPSVTGAFEPGLLDGLQVALVATDAVGATTEVATFDTTTSPSLARLDAFEVYAVSVPAGAYLTDAGQTYSFRVRYDGVELARSDLDPRVFTVLGAHPELQIGVKARIETSPERAPLTLVRGTASAGGGGACRAPVAKAFTHAGGECHAYTAGGGAATCAAYCASCPAASNAQPTYDEHCTSNGTTHTHSVSCTCCVPEPEICDGADNDCNGVPDEGNPGGGVACATGLPGACATGATLCASGALTCSQTVFPTTEVCDGVDNDCDGSVDEGNPGGGASCSTGLASACAAGTIRCTGGHLACVPNVAPTAEVCDRIDNDCDGVIDNGTCGPTAACTGPANGTINLYNGCYLITSFNQVISDGHGYQYSVIPWDPMYPSSPGLGPIVPTGWQWVNNCTNRPQWNPSPLGYWPGLIRNACRQ